MLLLAHVGVAQDAEALSVGGHEAVLDAVVHHLDEVAGAIGTAVQVTLLGSAVKVLAPGRARCVTRARRQRREDWIEAPDGVLFTTDHHAVTSLQAPHTTARPHVHVVDALGCEFLGAPDVIDVIGIAAVDEDVFRLKMGEEVGDGFLHDCRRDH